MNNVLSWSNWHVDPSIAVGVFLLCFGYTFASRRLAYQDQGPNRRQIVFFVAAVLTVLVALTSPLHDLSDNYLFSAHMVQHLLLILVMPPLLLASIPGAMLRPLIQNRWVFQVARFVTRPVIAFATCNFIFAVSHLPQLYEVTLRNHSIHIAEHFAFMLTAVMLWWPIMSPLKELPRTSYPGQLLYFFLQVIPGSLVGGLIAHTETVLYPFYAEAPRIFDISPVLDQQLGAVIMWVGGGFFFLVAFTVVFFRWAALDMAEGRAVEIARRRARSEQPR